MNNAHSVRRTARMTRVGAAASAVVCAVFGAAHAGSAQGLTAERTLLLYNSQNATSLAVRNMYVAARPGVLELDLNDSSLGSQGVTRANYLSRVRTPVLDYLAGTDGTGAPLSQRVIAIVTTRGVPSRVNGGDEFDIASTWASVESELTLVHQNLEATGVSNLPFRYAGPVRNPYYLTVNQPIDGYDRSNITTQRSFQYVSPGAWQVTGLTPGHVYLVCRIDAAGETEQEALDNIQALLDRSQDAEVDVCAVQALFDEWACPDQLDDDGFTFLWPSRDDFGNAATILASEGYTVTHDESFAFVTGPQLPDWENTPLLTLGSYGENHKVNACGEDPPGQGTYLSTYNFHPAALFASYESFNGNSIVNGQPRQGQAQVLDFISLGGSFTVGTVREPFTFAAAKLEFMAQNLYVHGMTFAEAAYSGIPAISWQNIPVGDPLARVTVVRTGRFDVNGDGVVDLEDLYDYEEGAIDVLCDGTIGAADRVALMERVRMDEIDDVQDAGM